MIIIWLIIKSTQEKLLYTVGIASFLCHVYLQIASTRLAALFMFPGWLSTGMRNSRRLYLAIINLSFSSWLEVGDGFMPGCGNLPSHKELAVRFPNAVITAKWPGGHSSRSRERTLEIWDPRFLCTPEHSIQIKTPKLMLAQSGSKFRRRKLLNKFLICYVKSAI